MSRNHLRGALSRTDRCGKPCPDTEDTGAFERRSGQLNADSPEHLARAVAVRLPFCSESVACLRHHIRGPTCHVSCTHRSTSLASMMGVTPILRLNLGPLTNSAGLSVTTCLTTSQFEKAAQRCQMLLNGRRRQRLGLDISGKVRRPNRAQLQAVFLASAAELRGCLNIRVRMSSLSSLPMAESPWFSVANRRPQTMGLGN
jgi:hypothetical protein